MPPRGDKKKRVEKRISAQRVRNLERALQEERLGLTALSTAFIKVSGDPSVLLARVDAMVRAAVDNPKVKARTLNALVAGQQMLERAAAIEAGKPQPLFDETTTPDVGHVDAGKVKELVAPPTEQQMGLAFSNGEGGHDVREALAEREATARRVQENIVRLFREHGPLSDRQIAYHYSLAAMQPPQSSTALKTHRIELTQTGRLLDTGERQKQGAQDIPVWDLVERAALT